MRFRGASKGRLVRVLTLVDPRLRREAATFELRYSCRSCAHFDEERRACAEGYPNEPHLEARIESGEALAFCKSFELG